MGQYRVAIIGAGRPRREDGSTGFGQGHLHARGYLATGRCEIVAIADVKRENAEAFRAEHGIPAAEIYADYRQLLLEVKPDVVSVTTWPHLHAEMVIAAAEAGAKAIHCEKPMAPTWGESRRMHQVCVQRGVQLTFNHQRRFEASFRTARRLIQEGAIGNVLQMQSTCSNLFDWGTHWFDMMLFFNGDTPAEWVIGQLDSRSEKSAFGIPLEDQGTSYIAYQNGVRGLLITGDGVQNPDGTRRSPLNAAHRIIGTEGVVEVGAPGSRVRLLNGAAAGFQEVPLDPISPAPAGSVGAGIADLLACLESGAEPELSSHKALRATELIFATYESSRRRARVDLPLTVDDSPFLTMLAEGVVGPRAS